MPAGLDFELREAIVNACGRAFWLKDPLRTLFLSCGVPAEMFDRYSDLSKFKIARNVLADLEGMHEDGHLIQRRILTELCKFRKIPDPTVQDTNSALEALRALKSAAVERQLIAEEQVRVKDARAQDAQRKQAGIAQRAEKTEKLRVEFAAMARATSPDEVQGRGYDLEKLIAELFRIHEISFRPSYRVGNEQIDGSFKYEGFDYLVEAKWRATPPTELDLVALKRKAEKKFDSLRGLFVSIAGFKSETLDQFKQGDTNNLVLMDGMDLALILEGRVSLRDALDMKIRMASQEGVVFYSLNSVFR